MELKVLALLLL